MADHYSLRNYSDQEVSEQVMVSHDLGNVVNNILLELCQQYIYVNYRENWFSWCLDFPKP